MKYVYFLLLNAVLIFGCSALFVGSAEAQRRDHLTKEEIELVRDVQDVDYRMDLFIKAVERRLWVLYGKETLSKDQLNIIEKDLEKWGNLPNGSRSELVSDIEKILEESIDKFEDVYEREPDSALLPFAYYILADNCERLIPRFDWLAKNATERNEIGRLEKASKHCLDILEARDRIPRPTGKRPKSKVTR